MRLQRLRSPKTCSQQAGDPQERMVCSSNLSLSLKAEEQCPTWKTGRQKEDFSAFLFFF